MIFRKIYPIIWRDLKISFCHINSLVGNFIAPSLLLGIFATGMSSNIQSLTYLNKQISYFDFFFPGLIGMQLVFITMGTISSLVLDTDRQISAIIVFSKVTMNHYYWGKYFASCIIILARALFLYLIAVLFFDFSMILQWENLLLIFVSLAGGVFIFYNIGFLIGAMIKPVFLRDLIMAILPTLLIFTSNSYYNHNNLPQLIKLVSIVNPLVYIVENLRNSILFSKIPLTWQNNLLIIFIICILVCPLSLMIKNKLIYKM